MPEVYIKTVGVGVAHPFGDIRNPDIGFQQFHRLLHADFREIVLIGNIGDHLKAAAEMGAGHLDSFGHTVPGQILRIVLFHISDRFFNAGPDGRLIRIRQVFFRFHIRCQLAVLPAG